MQSSVEGFRLSPQQRRLWKFATERAAVTDPAAVTDRFTGGDCVFSSQLVLSLEGAVRVDALREAVEKVCARHESLRITFRRLPGVAMPVQCVSDELTTAWQTVDLTESQTLEITDTTTVDDLLDRESRRAFDYENGPLVHATLFILGAEHHLLSITIPALCADRRTLFNLFLELSRESGGEPF